MSKPSDTPTPQQPGKKPEAAASSTSKTQASKSAAPKKAAQSTGEAKPKAPATAPKPAPKAPPQAKTAAKEPSPKQAQASTTAKPAPAKTNHPAPAPKAAPSANAQAITHGKTTARKPNKQKSPKLSTKFSLYAKLMRLDKPIGILLLLWPTLWALWLAAKGMPRWDLLVIFSLGVVLMRSAGCVINDFADRKIDGQVKRTQDRPLATGAVSSREALILFASLCLIAFGLVLLTDPLTIKLSVGGLILACCYPFMKRHTHLPQVVLGAAFAWGIPMAYAAQAGQMDKTMWVIYLTVVLWTVVYDTFYAMVDRDDDLKIGVKSTAILFGEQDRVITGALQLLVLYSLILIGQGYGLGWIFYLSVAVTAGLFVYQQWLIRYRERTACFKAFLNNNWVGAVIFAGIMLNLSLK